MSNKEQEIVDGIAANLREMEKEYDGPPMPELAPKKLKIYYAHPMIFYGSQVEYNDIQMLEALGFEVVNPNKPENETNYLKKKSFGVFLDLVRDCDALAFRSVINKITMGVGKEIEYAREHKMPVIELPTLTSDRFLSIEETQEYFRPLNVKD